MKKNCSSYGFGPGQTHTLKKRHSILSSYLFVIQRINCCFSRMKIVYLLDNQQYNYIENIK